MNSNSQVPDKITCGWIPFSRGITEEEIWLSKSDGWFKVYVYILMHVNHTDNQLCKRGQGYFNLTQLVDYSRFGKDVTYGVVDGCIRWLKKTKQITTRKSTRGVYITVVNYDQIMNFDNYEFKSEKLIENETESKQKINGNDTIYNNDNNENNDKLNTGNCPEIIKSIKEENTHKGMESVRDVVNGFRQQLAVQTPSIKYEWQVTARRYADELGITLGTYEARWFKLFRDAPKRGKDANIDKAYSYLKDHPKNLSNSEKIMFFFKISEKGLQIK